MTKMLAGFTYHLPERDKTTGKWPCYAWPGGYPIVYVTADMGNLCCKCANNNLALTVAKDATDDWKIVALFINWEDNGYCDNCNFPLEVAYPNA